MSKCPVKGHEHELLNVSDHVQHGTGIKAQTLECPTGRYRWFVIEGRPLSNALRMVRPCWGWRKP